MKLFTFHCTLVILMMVFSIQVQSQNWPGWRGPNGDLLWQETVLKGSWEEDLGMQYPSPVLADGLVYMPNDDGVITVIKPGPTFEAVSQNAIGEPMRASPAISNGKIYLRGDKHLFCIGAQ